MPAITVIVDGGWNKRLHRHSYNAKPGVVIIIGQATGKLLYFGLGTSTAQLAPNESHQISMPAIRTGMSPPLRWSQTSSWKDSSRAEQMHGVRYKRFVGDGDSSVYPTLIENMPGSVSYAHLTLPTKRIV